VDDEKDKIEQDIIDNTLLQNKRIKKIDSSLADIMRNGQIKKK